MSFEVVPVDKPADMNVIIGQAHFINTELPVLYARALGVRRETPLCLAASLTLHSRSRR